MWPIPSLLHPLPPPAAVAKALSSGGAFLLMKLLGSAVALPLTLLSAASSIDSHYTVVANRWEGERGWEEARKDRGESNGEHVITTGENYKGKVHSITSYCLLATEASG